MKAIGREKIEEFVSACRKAAGMGLLSCSSGNMSYRAGDGYALLSASKAWLGEITPEQVSLCRIEDGQCVNGPEPTIESVFHLGILRQRQDVNTVLHFQSPYATVISAGRAEDYDYNVIIEVPCYIGRPAVVGYYPPGSAELAGAVVEAMTTAEVGIMKNHGQVAVGADFNDVIQKAVFFELASQVLILRPGAEPIPQNQAEYLRKQAKA